MWMRDTPDNHSSMATSTALVPSSSPTNNGYTFTTKPDFDLNQVVGIRLREEHHVDLTPSFTVCARLARPETPGDDFALHNWKNGQTYLFHSVFDPVEEGYSAEACELPPEGEADSWKSVLCSEGWYWCYAPFDDCEAYYYNPRPFSRQSGTWIWIKPACSDWIDYQGVSELFHRV